MGVVGYGSATGYTECSSLPHTGRARETSPYRIGGSVMARSERPPLQRQLGRVQRRLLAQSILNALVWCWVVAILLAIAWFLLQPLLIHESPVWLRWTVGCGLAAMATVLG